MVDLPTKCPVCNSDLEWKGVDLVCTNKDCDNIKQSDLEIWTDMIGSIEGVKWLTRKKYLDNLNIRTVEDLMHYVEDVLPSDREGYVSITDQKILSMFDKLLEPHPLDKALQALNIERLGEVTSQKISKNKEAFESILKYVIGVEEVNWNLIEELVGQASMNTIRDNKEKLKRLNLIIIKKYEEPKQVEKKGTFCITGKLNSGSRADIIKMAEDKGWMSLNSVTKDCDYLVTNDTTSGSSKNKKAQKLGTKIINEEEFLNMINN